MPRQFNIGKLSLTKQQKTAASRGFLFWKFAITRSPLFALELRGSQ